MNEMIVNDGVKFVLGEQRRNPQEKPTQTPFRPPRNPHGVTERRTRDPSCGRRATNRLRHGEAQLRNNKINIQRQYIGSNYRGLNSSETNFSARAAAESIASLPTYPHLKGIVLHRTISYRFEKKQKRSNNHGSVK